MRLVVAAVALAACLLGSGWCQRDCAYPVDSDIRSVIANNIRTSDGSTVPTITLTSSFQLVCLAHSQLKDRYRAISFLVQYTCDGNSECPDGTVEEQFESQCVDNDPGNDADNAWSHEVLGSAGNTRTMSPSATSATVLREDCSFCATSERATGAGSPVTPDSVTHCIACQNCNSEEGGANRCFGFGANQCCSVYLPNGMCDTACPDGGVYIIDEDFDCLRNCPDSLGTVSNGEVKYSEAISGDGYTPGTEATVECSDGYEREGYGATCIADGTWNSTLSNCTEVVRCGRAPDLENGKLASPVTVTTVGAVATYECNDGYGFKDNRNTRTCQANKTWSNEDLECIKEEEVQCPTGCSTCQQDGEGKVSCTRCEGSLELNDNTCGEKRSGSKGDGPCGKNNIICIIIPIAILLAIILAIAVAAAVYAYYRWKQAPATKLKEKDAEGINGVARDNPLYLDPSTVAEEVEE